VKLSRSAKTVLGVITGLILLFIYLPLLLVVVNSFNADRTFGWPPSSFTLEWWSRAFESEGVRDALATSVQVAVVSTILSLVLGTLLALALQRYSFFGRDVINLLVILPIALPGIVTGIALNNMFTTVLGVPLSLWTVIVAHATFCMVTVFNNAIARLRRINGSLEEASADLGAGVFTTFALVTLPQLRSALLAGGLLAFALSFDEIIVTTFTIGAGQQTLPVWILSNLFRPNQAPVVNVVAVILIIVSIVPIWLAQRLSSDSVPGTGARALSRAKPRKQKDPSIP
jgi:putative spermidine/putrescine transport system permease protein